MPETSESPPPAPPRRFSGRVLMLAMIGAGLAAVGLAALLTNIFQRQVEARNPFYRVVELTDTTQDPAVWGKNFPLHYDAYRRTVELRGPSGPFCPSCPS